MLDLYLICLIFFSGPMFKVSKSTTTAFLLSTWSVTDDVYWQHVVGITLHSKMVFSLKPHLCK